ncbi:protein-glutamate O-methyltransferase CheR [Methylosinus sp. Sm6]|uniref:CheR family methyltransferase n=1 Tax=Methylosinus sp. Sm6 TaxID=2866948 RepID=UPI001C999736|nr:CheR family methyltransferase [Methylosinus sp. Sm6]MBY6243162.1 protein-glutamate O-methyltransferase CheR [Methylosinus sp. Sm6]
MASRSQQTAEIELDLLLEAIYRVHQYDFRGYARSSIRRNVARASAALGCATTTELLDRIVHDTNAFAESLRHLTIQVSDLFRDPSYFRLLRETVAPHLATYPSLRIWIAGCGTGEEAYSIAIILHEERLLERTLIYATDIDMESMAIARAGAYEASRMGQFEENYRSSGGRARLSDYFVVSGSRAVVDPLLRRRVFFYDHSLSTDASFMEAQLISCRNVLIYFDRQLQERSIALFRDSLCPRGFLGLGHGETLAFSRHASCLELVSGDEQIYRVK